MCAILFKKKHSIFWWDTRWSKYSWNLIFARQRSVQNSVEEVLYRTVGGICNTMTVMSSHNCDNGQMRFSQNHKRRHFSIKGLGQKLIWYPDSDNYRAWNRRLVGKRKRDREIFILLHTEQDTSLLRVTIYIIPSEPNDWFLKVLYRWMYGKSKKSSVGAWVYFHYCFVAHEVGRHHKIESVHSTQVEFKQMG